MEREQADIVNIANGLLECLRSLTDLELCQIMLVFTNSNNNSFNFRHAIEDPNSDSVSRTLVCLFHFIVSSNGTAARTLVEREAVRRFITTVAIDTREQQ